MACPMEKRFVESVPSSNPVIVILVFAFVMAVLVCAGVKSSSQKLDLSKQKAQTEGAAHGY